MDFNISGSVQIQNCRPAGLTVFDIVSKRSANIVPSF